MTKETGSGYTPISLFYRSPRLIQGLSVMGSLSVLSSGLVIAQTDSLIDRGTAPPSTGVQSAPAPAPEPPQRRKPAVRESGVAPERPARRFAQTAIEPRTPPAPAAAKKPSASRRESEITVTKPRRVRSSEETVSKPTRRERSPEETVSKPTRRLRSQEASDSIPATLKKPALKAPNLSLPDNETVAKPPKLFLSPAQTQDNPEVPYAATNRYIDRTDYSIGATGRNDRTDPVIMTDRSSGCRAVSLNGQLSSGICGTAAPIQETASQERANQRMATRSTINQQAEGFRSIGQETRLAGISKLPVPPVAMNQPVNLGSLGSVRSGASGSGISSLRLPRQTRFPTRFPAYASQRVAALPRYSSEPLAALPVQPYPVSQGWTASSDSGMAYYNLTARPAGRPNIGNTNFMFPLAIPSAITSVFGWRVHPISGDYRFHAGTDLGAPTGTPVLAAVAGQVITADFMGGYGLTIVVQHQDGKDLSLYGHLSEIFVRPGDRVEQGNVIGRVGSTGNSTGPHLHFEWRHLTPNGWVALDAGTNLEYSLAQFMKSLQVAQTPPQSVSQRGL
ncbi:MAG TPA: M23 family metallopeptidase [Waterburya sp.]